ncbi:MAG: ATP-dependent Clp protease proteolytic subunit [Anaerolineae bacterium]|nr:ATP-dependent Clp protease proteolytic subunit [Anaerolineae bacterium]
MNKRFRADAPAAFDVRVMNLPLNARELGVLFFAPVSHETAAKLIQTLQRAFDAGFRRVHLALSTPATGSARAALALSNFLRGVPLELRVCNFGQLDLAGIVLYCAVKRRLCAPGAKFLMSGVWEQIDGVYDEAQLDQARNTLRANRERMCHLVAEATGQARKTVAQDFEDRRSFDPLQACEYGLAHEIRVDLIPGTELVAILGDLAVAGAEDLLQ